MRLTRREAMQLGLFGATGLFVADRLAARTWAAPGAAKSVIQIWMWGGPSHLDTFDPKPDAGYDYYGALGKPIATNVSGIVISELLPLLAQAGRQVLVIRSMTHGINAHETASYAVQTGRKPGEHIVFPSAGAVVSLFKGVQRRLPGPDSAVHRPHRAAGPVLGGGIPGPAVHAVRHRRRSRPAAVRRRRRRRAEHHRRNGSSDRRELLRQLTTMGNVTDAGASLDAFTKSSEQAYDLILGDAGKVFDLSQETDAMRDRYGRNTFGQSCMVARRLVERGVPYITINYQGWDTHKQNFQTMRQKLPQMDQGLATLLQDLSERGLLDSTIVWWGGEFGRTPRVQWEAPWNGGRGHWGQAFCALLAGGGFKGGQVVGATDARGEEVRTGPSHPPI